MHATDTVEVVSYSLTINNIPVELDASHTGSYTFTAPGTYLVAAAARNINGVLGNKGLYITVVAQATDTEKPVVNITHNASSTIYAGQSIDFSVTATDNVGVTSLVVTVNGQQVALNANGGFNYTFSQTGTYTILATAGDAAGNFGTYQVVFEVTAAPDTEAPVVTIDHNAGDTIALGQNIDFLVTATDNVGVTSMVVTVNGQQVTLDANGRFSYAFTQYGKYEIVATAYDAAGNSGFRKVVFELAAPADTEAPVVNITHNAGATITLGQSIEFQVTATDNVGVTSTVVTVNGQQVALDANGRFSYAFTQYGEYKIVAIAYDAAGNAGTYTLNWNLVVPEDTTAPSVTITHNAGGTITAGQTIEFHVTAHDNVGVESLVVTMNGQEVALDANGRFIYSFSEAGTYVILATARDAAGNAGEYKLTFTVSAKEIAAPSVTINHNGGSVITNGQTVNFTIVADGEAAIASRTLTINGQTVTLDANGSGSYTFSSTGIYYIVATATDVDGRVGTKNVIISVVSTVDIEAPVVTVIHNAPETLYPGQTVQFTVTATDNVGVVSRSLTINGQTVQLDANGSASYTFGASGAYAIIGTAYDAAGNVGMQTVILHVVARDVEAPVVTLGHTITGETFVGDTLGFTVNATDNVGVVSRMLTVNGVEIALDGSHRGEYTFTQPGTYVIVGTAYDAAGNVGMQTITLTVKAARDTEAPTVDIVHNAPADLMAGRRVDFTVVADDNVGVVSRVLLINGQSVALDAAGNASYVFASAGTYSVVAVAMDAAGNIGTKTLVITVAPERDVEAPVVTIVHDASGTLLTGRTVNFTINATDNVGVVSRELTINGQAVQLDGTFQASYTFSAAGTYTIVATARDAAGNIGTQTLILTVAAPRDTEAPVIYVTHNGADFFAPGQTVDFTVFATDNVAVVNTILMINGQIQTLDANGMASYTFGAPGYYSLVAIAIDSSGNIGTYTQVLQVKAPADVVAPVVTISHNSSGLLDAGQSVTFTVNATDNVGVVARALYINGEAVQLDASHRAAFTFDAPGTYVIHATATDAAGNVGTQTITLTVRGVVDTEPPEVSIAHNGGSTVYTGDSVGFVVTATDNVGVVSLEVTMNGQVVTPNAQGRFDYTFAVGGTYTVVATARDAAGNTTTRTLVLEVATLDKEPPVVTIARDTEFVFTGDTVEFAVGATDNIGVVGLEVTLNGEAVTLVDGKFSHHFSAAGTYVIVATARDAQGNVGTATLTLTIGDRDLEPPVVKILHDGGAIHTGDTVEFTVDARDNVGVTGLVVTVNDQVVTLVDGKFSYHFAAAGTYTIVAIARDAAGNFDIATLSITIVDRDSEKPEVAITYNNSAIFVNDTVEFAVTADDNVGIASLEVTVNGQVVTLVDGKFDYTFAEAGNYLIVATATDAQGNIGVATLSLTVGVRDTEPPTVDISYPGDAIFAGDTVEFTVDARDNVGVASLVVTVNNQYVTLVDGKFSYDFAAAGTYIIAATATDAAGNYKTVTLVLTVGERDAEAPTVDIVYRDGAVFAGDSVEFTVDTRDNVGVASLVVTVNDELVTLVDGKFTYDFAAAGTYTIVAVATDAAGNSKIATLIVTVGVRDSIAPTVEIIRSAQTIHTGDTVEFTVDARDNVGVESLVVMVNDQVVTLVDGKFSYTFASSGTYTITAVAIDAQGNIGTQTLVLEIGDRDSEDPVVTIGQPGGAVHTGDTVEFTVDARDNVGVASLVVTVNGEVVTLVDGKFSYTFASSGTYTIVATATDAQGNVGTATLEVVVANLDNEAPTVAIIDNGGALYAGDTGSFTVDARDNVGVARLEVTVNGEAVTLDAGGGFSYTFAAPGTYLIVATAWDAQGNSAVATLDVTIAAKDSVPPTVEIIPGAQSVFAGDRVEFTVDARDNVGVTSLVVTVNGEAVTLVNGKFDYTFAAPGAYVIIATATDAQGNSAVARYELTVGVRDDEAPVVEITRSAENIYTGDTVEFTVDARDNIGVASLVVTVNGEAVTLADGKFSYTFAASGTYTIIATATDAQGNSGFAKLVLVIGDRDTENPVVEILHGADAVFTGDTVEFTVNARDNVGVESLVVTVNDQVVTLVDGKFSYTFAAPGTYTIIATATDAQGNIGIERLVFTVVDRDSEAPVVEIVRGAESIFTGDTVEFTVNARDNVGVESLVVTVNGQVVTLIDGKFSFTFAASGIYTITATATDAQGNIGYDTLVLNVSVRDTEPPVVEITRGAGAVFAGDTVEFTVNARDNIGVESLVVTVNGQIVTLVDGKFEYSFGSAGVYVIVATATDAQGNSGVAKLELTVVARDTEAPTVEIIRGADAIFTGDTVEFIVNARDNVGVESLVVTVNGEVVTLVDGKFSYTFAASGTYTIVATATDAQGNSAVAKLVLTIGDKDTEKPVVKLSHNGGGSIYNGQTVVFSVSATDNVGVTGMALYINGRQVALDADGKASYVFAAAGTYTILATATDAAGNVGEKTLTLTIKKDGCAPTVNLKHNGGCLIYAGKTVEFTVTATDNVGVVEKTLTINGQTVELDANGKASYTFAAAGTYTIVATVRDGAGNVSKKTITLTVKKDSCAPTVGISHNGGCVIYAGKTIDFAVTAVDNVGVVERTLTINGQTVELNANGKASYTFLAAGTYTIVATARDAAGNVGKKTITLTVKKDTTAPTVGVSHNGGCQISAGKTVEFTVTATDNVGVVERTLTINGQTVELNANGKASYTFVSGGTYTVVATARDAAGNVGTRTITVTVKGAVVDTQAPNVEIKHNAAGVIAQGQKVTFTIAATDNVGVVEKTLAINGQKVTLTAGGMAVYTFAAAGKYTVEATARDAAGNVGIKTIYLTVAAAPDIEAPKVDIAIEAPYAVITAGNTVNFTVSATDNVGVVWLELSINGVPMTFDAQGRVSFTFSEAGTYTVVAYATDEAGNIGRKEIRLNVLERR